MKNKIIILFLDILNAIGVLLIFFSIILAAYFAYNKGYECGANLWKNWYIEHPAVENDIIIELNNNG